MATVHLLHGFVGAGKTTFAKQLAQETHGVCFSPDEWMEKLYGNNPPATHFQDHLSRVVDLMWLVGARLLSLNIDLILDFGFWTRPSRDEARQKARALGATVKLYRLNCPEAEMRRRVLARTAQMPAGALWINAAAIDLFWSKFEPLAEDEERIEI